MRLLTLGKVYADRATAIKGTLTHWFVDMDHHVTYLLQPNALNSEGQPAKKILLGAKRLAHSDVDFEEIDVPTNILGTEVKHKLTAFTGMAIELAQHINGCLHICIQPKGLVASSGQPHKTSDFDIRECVGEQIPVLSQEEVKASHATTPSPCDSSHNTKELGPVIPRP